MNAHPGYTVTASLLALVFAALIWTVGRQRWPRVVVLLVITGVGGLTNTTAGGYAHRAVVAGETWMGNVTGYLFGVVFAGIIAIVCAAVVGFHLHHKTVGRTTLIAAGTLPLTATLCPTDPSSRQCLQPPAASFQQSFAANATPTFSIFVTGSGAVANNPGVNRVFVRFKDSGGVTRGATSVAVRTQ